MRKQVIPSRQLEVIRYEPDRPDGVRPEVLFVHGSCHSAACWSFFQEYFAHAGYGSLAFSFRGHGKSSGGDMILLNRLQDYVSDLDQVVKEHVRTPFVLIGHSLGGYVVQSYLSQGRGQQPRASILLTSVTPFQARKVSRDARTVLPHVFTFLRAYVTGNARMFYTTPEQTRYWFFTASTPQEIVENCFSSLQDESMRASVDLLRLPTPEKLAPPFQIPLLLVGAQCDTILPVRAIEASAQAYGAQALIFANRGHDLMLDQGWEHVAEQIVQWIKKQELSYS